MRTDTLDVTVSGWLVDHRSPVVTSLCRGAMWLGTSLTGMAVVAVVALAVALWRRKLLVLVAAGFSAGGTGAVVIVLKRLIERPRPGPPYAIVDAYGYSMPSTAVAVTVAASVVLLLIASDRRVEQLVVAAALLLANLAVGFAVIYLGAHWFTDVLAGAFVGAVGGTVVWWATRWLLAAGWGSFTPPVRGRR